MFSCLKENKHKPEFDKRYSHNAPRQYDVRDARFSNSYVLGQAFVVSFIMFALRQQGVIGNGVISLLWQLRCHCNPLHNKVSSLSNTIVVAIFPNRCFWRRSLWSTLRGIDPEKLYRATLNNNDGDGYKNFTSLKSELALLQTWFRSFHLVYFVKCWQMFLELDAKGLHQSLEKEKQLLSCVRVL